MGHWHPSARSAKEEAAVGRQAAHPVGDGLLPFQCARSPLSALPSTAHAKPRSQLHAGTGLRRHALPWGRVPVRTSRASTSSSLPAFGPAM